MYKIFSVKGALEILDIESASHFIKRYKDHRGYTPGLFCKKERRDWAEKKRKNDRDYLHWCEFKEYYQIKK